MCTLVHYLNAPFMLQSISGVEVGNCALTAEGNLLLNFLPLHPKSAVTTRRRHAAAENPPRAMFFDMSKAAGSCVRHPCCLHPPSMKTTTADAQGTGDLQ